MEPHQNMLATVQKERISNADTTSTLAPDSNEDATNAVRRDLLESPILREAERMARKVNKPARFRSPSPSLHHRITAASHRGVMGFNYRVPCRACGQKTAKRNLKRHVITKHNVALNDVRDFVARCVNEETLRLRTMRQLERKRAALMSSSGATDGPATAYGMVTRGDGDVREGCDVPVAGDVELASGFVEGADGGEAVVCGDNVGSMTSDDGAESERVGGDDETRDAGGGVEGPNVVLAGGVGVADTAERGSAAVGLIEAAEEGSCDCCSDHRRQEAKVVKCLTALHRLEAKQKGTKEAKDLPSTSAANAGTPKWLMIKQRDGEAFGICKWCRCHSTNRGSRFRWSGNGMRLFGCVTERVASHAGSMQHRISAEAERARVSGSPCSTSEKVKSQDRGEAQERNFTVAYSIITGGGSYADFGRELLALDAIFIERLLHRRAHVPAAHYVDVIYDVFRNEVTQYIRLVNPATGRPRHVHVSMDRVTVAGVTRQAVNLRLLDTDATTVVVHGLTAVRRPHPDPVPIYTAILPPRLRDAVTNKNMNNGRGVLAQVTDYLQNDLGLTMDEIGRQALSASSHCETMYTNPVSGFGRIWKELHGNPAFLHLPDRPHQLEALFDNFEVHPACDWMVAFTARLYPIASVIKASYQLSHHSRKTDEHMDMLCSALQRFVEKPVVANTVGAIECLLTSRTIVVSVLKHGNASGVIDKDAARSALNSLQDASFLLEALAVLDIMRPAVALITAGQEETYSVFDDKRGVHQLKTDIEQLTNADFSGSLEGDGPDVVSGTFRGAPLQLSAESAPDRNPADVTTDILLEVKNRRRDIAQTILGLPSLDRYLGQSDVEKLMTDVFNFDRYPTDDSGLETHADDRLVDLVTRLSEGPVALPRGCGTACRGPACQCLIAQFREFKRNVMAKREHFKSKWYAVRDGVVGWQPEAVLRSFMQPENSLHGNIPDITELIEMCLVLSRSQTNIEGVRKPAKFVVENLGDGQPDGVRRKKRDHERREVFIRENRVPVRFFPAKWCWDRWQNLDEHVMPPRGRVTKQVTCDGKDMKFMFSKV